MAQPAAALAVEAEDFVPRDAGWRVVKNGEGNMMVDAIGFTHISGERLLSAPADASDARAVAAVVVPVAGDYKVWARFEQPVGTENRFTVRIRQNGREIGAQTLGERAAVKQFFGLLPSADAGAPWGWDGLVEQGFVVRGLQAGSAQIELIAPAQQQPRADRNLDLLYLTTDLSDGWRTANPANLRYPILDAALQATPPRYYLRLSSPDAQTFQVGFRWNRIPWRVVEGNYPVVANAPGAWMPLTRQDVAHFSTLVIAGKSGQGIRVRAELASDPQGRHLLRALDWRDPQSSQLLLSLPPYPGKYRGESILTVEEQYGQIADFLQTHPPDGGREPARVLTWANSIPVWERGRVGDAAARVYRALGMRAFVGFAVPQTLPTLADVARERFEKWSWQPNRAVALGAYRNFPTPENIETARAAAQKAGVLPDLQRFDYGDEISFAEWLKPIPQAEINARFARWQQEHNGKVQWETPDSRGVNAADNPELYVDSSRFYEETAIQSVAQQAKSIAPALGPDVLYGANYLAHPYYYPRIAPYIKWFRGGAANFGRHSEYFWQVHQPGPMVNGYLAEHFRAGMRDNPRALLQQYTMPHSPGNTDASFLRSAFTHLAHGARALDFFGIGVQSSDTENYIDFRDKSRFAAVRQVNRYLATVEDIVPQSRVVPSRVALILSDSSERWDLAAITGDRESSTVEGVAGIGANDPRVRLTYHQERVGLYYALVNASRPPDLLTEEDVQNGRLKDYDVAYWVGDCAENATVVALRDWVQNGGKLTATAGALRNDEYQRPVAAGRDLLGLASAQLTETVRFVRPLIELPRLPPLDDVAGMPALAMLDEVAPAPGARVTATFKSGKPAVIAHRVGRGQTTFIATLPGLAYLWSAYQPPPVPTHGPSSHVVPQLFNARAAQFITAAARQTTSAVDAGGARLDARLLQSPVGYAIPIANYGADVNAPVTLTIRGVPRVRRISSARRGILKWKRARDGAVTVRYAPGLVDMLKLD